MQVGDISVWERTFTEEDVRLFTRVSGDQGIQHMKPDEQGRLQVHGLLTATLPTKLGVRYELYRTPDGL
jgi:3-hydroxybutyryl-CoA dehydratase